MHPADPKPIVRLFPRIATPRSTTRQAPRRATSAATVGDRDEIHRQLRARLLRMILDNEQVRRNDQRPSAS